MNVKKKHQFQRALLKWFSYNKRDFIWRKATTPPELVLVSEMLLRKTQAQSVESVVALLLQQFPTIQHLSTASIDQIASIIKPLGLQNVRARAIKQAATIIYKDHHGKVPHDPQILIKLPHVGRYSANAVCCFAYNQKLPVVDSNVVRIYSRAFNKEVPREVHKAELLWMFSLEMLPNRRFRDYNWALLDLGALICSPSNQLCDECPVSNFCGYFNNR